MTMSSTKKTDTLDCLLISPPRFYGNAINIWSEIDSNFPPLGLASIAGYVRSLNYSVQMIDSAIVAPTTSLFESYFTDHYVSCYANIRFIGLTATTSTIKKAYRIAQICKNIYPECTIVFGGVHATFLSEEVLSQPFVDIVVAGEGELTMAELLSGQDRQDIKGIVYKSGNGDGAIIIKNKPRERIDDLDALPLPAYDLLPITQYRPAKGSYKRLPAMSLMTSRGCPGRCSFCNKTLGDRIVFQSAERILEEIKYLTDHYGIREILFYDDTFTLFKANVSKLCQLLINHHLDLSWTCFARVDFVDPQLLLQMKAAGCHQIMYGVENIDEQVLKNINKKINREQILQAVRWTREAKIECRLAFMVGNPGDSRDIIMKNIEFLKILNPDLLIVNIATPFPGTEMFKWADEKGLLLTYDWDDYTLAEPVMRLENLSGAEIRELYKLMYRGFYFRPQYIIKKLFSIRSWTDYEILLDGFRALWAFLWAEKAKREDLSH